MARHPRIDFETIGQYLVERRTREHPALRPRMHRPNAVAVTVEQEMPIRADRRVARQRAQHKLFKKPCGVGEMPFRRTGIGHALHHRVFRGQRRNELDAADSQGGVAFRELGRCGCRGFERDRHQRLTNRYAKRSVSPLIEGSNTLIECSSSLFARMMLSASSTKPAASISSRTDAGSIRCSDWASLVPAPTAAA